MTTRLYTWVFNNTRGSLWPVLLFHTSQGVTNLFLSSADDPVISFVVDAVLVVAVILACGPARLTRRNILQMEGA